MLAASATETATSHFLYPGMVFAKSGDFCITTVLGSCVSVCLWDCVLRVGGMNHFLLPGSADALAREVVSEGVASD